MYLAYKYVMVCLMLAEINFTASRLNFGQHFPVEMHDLVYVFVETHDKRSEQGCIYTSQYCFCFSENGRLRFIEMSHPFGDMHIAERDDMLLKQKSIIDKAEAYRMATNWLTLMTVDVPKLEAENRPNIVHEGCVSRVKRGQMDLLPLFEITWGKGMYGDESVPHVLVEIDGRNKGLIRIRLEDESVSQRPAGLIKNRDELLSISDQEFLSYTDQQREDLVKRFMAISYDPSPTNQVRSATNANDAASPNGNSLKPVGH